jgi:predicted  nucleic acid-binding Zn-ribbon protein
MASEFLDDLVLSDGDSDTDTAQHRYGNRQTQLGTATSTSRIGGGVKPALHDNDDTHNSNVDNGEDLIPPAVEGGDAADISDNLEISGGDDGKDGASVVTAQEAEVHNKADDSNEGDHDYEHEAELDTEANDDDSLQISEANDDDSLQITIPADTTTDPEIATDADFTIDASSVGSEHNSVDSPIRDNRTDISHISVALEDFEDASRINTARDGEEENDVGDHGDEVADEDSVQFNVDDVYISTLSVEQPTRVNKESGIRNVASQHASIDPTEDNAMFTGTPDSQFGVNINDDTRYYSAHDDPADDSIIIINILKQENQVLIDRNVELVNENGSLKDKVDSLLMLNETLRKQCVVVMSQLTETTNADTVKMLQSENSQKAQQLQQVQQSHHQMQQAVASRDQHIIDFQSQLDVLEAQLLEKENEFQQYKLTNGFDIAHRRQVDELERDVQSKKDTILQQQRELQRLSAIIDTQMVSERDQLLTEMAALSEANEDYKTKYIEAALSLEEANEQMIAFKKLVETADSAARNAAETASNAQMTLAEQMVGKLGLV